MHTFRTNSITLLIASTTIFSHAQRFVSFGGPDFSILQINSPNIELGYPKVNLIEIDPDGNIHLKGDYYFEVQNFVSSNSSSSSSNSVNTSTTRACVPFCASSNSGFKFLQFPENYQRILNSKAAHQNRAIAINVTYPHSGQGAYKLFTGTELTPKIEGQNEKIIALSNSGRHALIQKFGTVENPIFSSISSGSLPITTLPPFGKSRAMIFSEQFNEDRTSTFVNCIVGIVHSQQHSVDRIALWEKNHDSPSFVEPIFVEDQETLILPRSISKDGTIICGEEHLNAKKFSELSELESDRCLPIIVENDGLLTKTNLRYLYKVEEQQIATKIPGRATHVSSCGSYVFASISNPEAARKAIGLDRLIKEYLEGTLNPLESAEPVIADQPSVYFKFTEKGKVPMVSAKFVEATVCGDYLCSLKQAILDWLKLLQEENLELVKFLDDEVQIGIVLADNNKLQEKIELITKWHFIEVFTSCYDSKDQITFVGLGINPTQKYELFSFTIPSSEFMEVLPYEQEEDDSGTQDFEIPIDADDLHSDTDNQTMDYQ